jgi:hypothetical protein
VRNGRYAAFWPRPAQRSIDASPTPPLRTALLDTEIAPASVAFIARAVTEESPTG